MFVLGAGLTVLVCATSAEWLASAEADENPASFVTWGMMFAQITAVVLGTLVVTSEYGTGMIRATLAATPRRGAVLAAKAVVLTGTLFVAGTVTAFAGYFGGNWFLDSEGVGIALSDDGVLRAMFGSGLYMAGLGLLAAARRAAGPAHRRRAVDRARARVRRRHHGVPAPRRVGRVDRQADARQRRLADHRPGVVQPGRCSTRGPASRCSPPRWPSCWWSAGSPSAAGTPEPPDPVAGPRGAPPRRPGRPRHSGGVTSPDPHAEGRRRAEEFLALLDGDDAAADRLLAALTDVRDLVFLGAGLTAIARAEARCPAAGAARAGQHPAGAPRSSSATPTAATSTACAPGCAELGRGDPVHPLAAGHRRPRERRRSGGRLRAAAEATGSDAQRAPPTST